MWAAATSTDQKTDTCKAKKQYLSVYYRKIKVEILQKCKISSFNVSAFLGAIASLSYASTPTSTHSRLLHSFRYPLKQEIPDSVSGIFVLKVTKKYVFKLF